MKQLIYLLTCLIGVVVTSCQSDEPEKEPMSWCGGQWDRVWVEDATCLGSMKLRGVMRYEYIESDTLTSYNSHDFDFELHRDNTKYFDFERDPDFSSIKSLSYAYINEKMKKINDLADSIYATLPYIEHPDSLRDLGIPDGKMFWYPAVFSATVNGKISVTCDKTLYGQKPGTNIADYFLTGWHLNDIEIIGVEEPKAILPSKNIHLPLSEAYCEGLWLRSQSFHVFSFGTDKDGNFPTEKYDELTLTLSIPVKIESTYSYAASKYFNKQIGQHYTDTVFTASHKLYFKWE